MPAFQAVCLKLNQMSFLDFVLCRWSGVIVGKPAMIDKPCQYQRRGDF
jgi:hypothetical protein